MSRKCVTWHGQMSRHVTRDIGHDMRWPANDVNLTTMPRPLSAHVPVLLPGRESGHRAPLTTQMIIARLRQFFQDSETAATVTSWHWAWCCWWTTLSCRLPPGTWPSSTPSTRRCWGRRGWWRPGPPSGRTPRGCSTSGRSSGRPHIQVRAWTTVRCDTHTIIITLLSTTDFHIIIFFIKFYHDYVMHKLYAFYATILRA